MGAIARSAANLVTTSGVWLKGGVNNDSFDNVTALPSSLADGITLISSQTANDSASISFTSGLTSTYKAYKFVFVDIHPRTDSVDFSFQGSTDSGSNYGVTMTTTQFRAYHFEDDSVTQLAYNNVGDLAQSTSFQFITGEIKVGNGADECCVGSLQLFNPSSTTYVKHFIINNQTYNPDNISANNFIGGYFNTTSAINAIQFKMTSGNFDGKIYMYGIK